MDEEKFGDFNEFDLIGDQFIELTFKSDEQSKFESSICASSVDQFKYFQGDVKIDVAGSNW